MLAVGAAALAATIGVTGAVAASASTMTEHFSIVSTSATSNVRSVIATGAFTAGGTDISGNTVDKMQFPGGNLTVTHKGPVKVTTNPKTCLVTETGTGTYSVSGGTGIYRGISGSGTFKLSVMLVEGRSSGGKCSMNVKPAAFQFMVDASGPVSLP